MIKDPYNSSNSQSPITEVRFTPARPLDMARGLFGYITCILSDIILLDGITLRKTLDGRLTLSFPAREDGNGNKHFYIQPLDDESREEVERRVFDFLGIKDVSA